METLEAMPSIIASTRNMIGKSPYLHRSLLHSLPRQSLWRGGGDQPRQRPRLPLRHGPAPARPVRRRLEPRPASPPSPRAGSMQWRWVPSRVRRVSSTARRTMRSPGSMARRPRSIPPITCWRGLVRRAATSGSIPRRAAPSTIAALAHQSPDGKELWLANLTAETQKVKVTGLKGAAELHRLSDANFTALATTPDFLSRPGEPVKKLSARRTRALWRRPHHGRPERHDPGLHRRRLHRRHRPRQYAHPPRHAHGADDRHSEGCRAGRPMPWWWR